MKKYHYVYLTTNLVNDKCYVGDHSTNNLVDGYLGSGTALRGAIKKYKVKNFKREILEWCKSKEEAFNKQEYYIKKYKSLISENGYNISPKGGHQISGGMTVESRKKLSATRIKNKTAVGANNPMYNKSLMKHWLEEYDEITATKKYNEWIAKHKNYRHSIKTITQISKSLKGKKPWNLGLTKEMDNRLLESANNMSKKRKNIPKTNSHKINMSISHKESRHILTCEYCKKQVNNSGGAFTKYHGKNCESKN